MKIKRMLRILSVILVVIVLTVSLSACRLPASQGPEETASGEYPVPGASEQPSGVETLPTATTAPGQEGGSASGETGQPAAATATPAPAEPQETQKPVEYVQATPGIPTSYVLKYGEFPFCIARRFNVNQYELLSMNGLNVNSTTYVGMTLLIPQTGNHFDGDPALKPHPADYSVNAGETLEIIACKFGNVSPDMIALQNNLQSPYTLTVGQKLVIP